MPELAPQETGVIYLNRIKMKKLLITLGFFGLLFSASAYGVPADLVIEFDAPTTREGGDPLPDSEIRDYVFYDSCVAGATRQEILTVPNTGNLSSASTVVDWADNSQHDVCFVVVDTEGVVGPESNVYSFTFDLIGRPGAGNIRTITITCAAQRCRVIVN